MADDQRSSGDDPTRPLDSSRDSAGSEADATRRLDRLEGEAPLRDDTSAAAGSTGQRDAPDTEPGAPRRARAVAIALVSALVGFVIAFVVVALGTDDGVQDAQLAALQEEVGELEAVLAERDARIAELEARVEEAEAAAGDRAADIEAQREALDERARRLDEREAALDEHATAIEERARAVEEAAEDGTAPTLDEEATQGIVDRVVDQIRDLFQ